MGCFDSVWVNCPVCETHVEFQTKAGGCTLKNYGSDSVPLGIALALSGDTEICPKCYTNITLEYSKPYVRVHMDIIIERADYD